MDQKGSQTRSTSCRWGRNYKPEPQPMLSQWTWSHVLMLFLIKSMIWIHQTVASVRSICHSRRWLHLVGFLFISNVLILSIDCSTHLVCPRLALPSCSNREYLSGWGFLVFTTRYYSFSIRKAWLKIFLLLFIYFKNCFFCFVNDLKRAIIIPPPLPP